MNFEYVQKLFTNEETTDNYVDYYADEDYEDVDTDGSTILDEIIDDYEEFEDESESILTNFFEDDEEYINFIPMKNKRYAEIEE